MKITAWCTTILWTATREVYTLQTQSKKKKKTPPEAKKCWEIQKRLSLGTEVINAMKAMCIHHVLLFISNHSGVDYLP